MSTNPLPTPNPLMGWPGQNVNQSTSVLPPSSPVTGPPPTPWGNPGGLEDPNTNLKDMIRNAGLLNVQQGQMRNQMIPLFANLMQGYAGPAGDFFKKLMDLGSPYYQQKQREGFEAGTGAINQATGQARQQLESAGYGATPSGATAGMIGGMNIAGGQGLAEQFLQNLFQNENMQMGGAQGLEQLASMFNPAPLFGSTNVTGTTQGPSAADEFAKIMGSIFGSSGVSKSTFTG